jgi:hypothetical protein
MMRFMPVLLAYTVGFIQGANSLSGWRNVVGIAMAGALLTALQLWNLALQGEEQRP